MESESEFDQALTRLFGSFPWRKAAALFSEFESYTTTLFPVSLEGLVQEYLRPQLAPYAREHQEDFVSLFESEEQCDQAIQWMERGLASITTLDLQVLSHMVGRSLTLENLDDGSTVAWHVEGTDESEAVQLSIQSGVVLCLVEVDKVPVKRREPLGLSPLILTESSMQSVDENTVRDGLLERKLHTLLKAIPQHLTNVATTHDRPTVHHLNKLPTPVNSRFMARFDMDEETRKIRHAVDNVELENRELIGTMGEWALSMSVASALALPGGLAPLGLAAATGEIIIAGAGMTAALTIGLPVGIAVLFSMMATAYVGKEYAVQYHEMLLSVKERLSEGEYEEAARLLDTEFNRWGFTRSARWLFLTYDHYSLAHFFKAACEDNLGHDAIAYTEYQHAIADAKLAKSPLIEFLSKLQLLKLMKKHPDMTWPDGVNYEQGLRPLLEGLTEDYADGFAYAYWSIFDTMQGLATRMAHAQALSAQDRSLLNEFIVANGFSSLMLFSKGHGLFLHVFSEFFQGAALTYTALHDNTILAEQIRQVAVELNPRNIDDSNAIKKLASYAFKRSATQLKLFKEHYSSLAQTPRFTSAIRLIEQFMLVFYGHINNTDDELYQEHLRTIQGRLSIPATAVTRVNTEVQEEVTIIKLLQRDFGVGVKTVDEWLDALLTSESPLVSRISARTGDTMLHALTYLPKHMRDDSRVKPVANLLEHHRLTRNHQGDTPLCPREGGFNLKPLLKHDTYIQLGDEIKQVERYVQDIAAHPEKDGHFLLLEGPPGTGKTTAVLRHLKAQGYAVHEWKRGTENDAFHNQVIARITILFQQVKQAARRGQLQIIFIDEIHGVLPRTQGVPDARYHNEGSDVTAFLTEITALSNHRVVLIGATNYPHLLPRPALQRAGINRVYFSLPNETQRRELLLHLFRTKRIELPAIEALAEVSIGYSHRELTYYVEGIAEQHVTLEDIKASFNRYAETIKRDFKREYGCADLFMPSFERDADFERLFSHHPALGEQLRRLQYEMPADPNQKHTLLYGPPGSGKTTAVRSFAQTSGRTLIAVNADRSTSSNTLKRLFDKAKSLGRVILFFDEMHHIAYQGSPYAGLLQKEMDGMLASDVSVVGATNYREQFEDAVLSRFLTKIELLPLGASVLSRPIRQSLVDGVKAYVTSVYFDTALAHEMEEGATQLAEESEGLDFRQLNTAIRYLFGDLQREQPLGFNGITYIRFQDLQFTFAIMKIQERLIPRPPEMETISTSTQYIREHRHSFFQDIAPENSVLAPRAVNMGMR